MNVESPERRTPTGLDLLLAHCAGLDPERPTARERLESALGSDLAGKLVFALSAGAPSDRRSPELGAWAVFAA
jgi:hypothetical protein